MGRRTAVAAGVVAVAAAFWPFAVAQADDSVVLVSDDGHVQLADGDDSTTMTGTVTLSNNTASKVRLTVDKGPEVKSTCDIDLDPPTLEPLRQQTVTVTFADCAADLPLTFAINTDVAGTDPDPVIGTLTADAPETAAPEWLSLLAFPVAAILGALVVGLTYVTWAGEGSRRRKDTLIDPLPGLADTWSFKDSWATNATVVAAIFTGVFGATDVAKAIFGDESKDVVALIGVGSAISLGLTGAAPMLVQLLKNKAGKPTPAGILVAATATVTGTAGVLVVAIWAAVATKLGNSVGDVALIVAGALGVLVLGVYASRATIQTLRVGIVPPPKDQKGKLTVQLVTPATASTHDVDLNAFLVVGADGAAVPASVYKVEYQEPTAAESASGRAALL
jgi:uncharacterized membrane protein